jgi:hypothetical protein
MTEFIVFACRVGKPTWVSASRGAFVGTVVYNWEIRVEQILGHHGDVDSLSLYLWEKGPGLANFSDCKSHTSPQFCFLQLLCVLIGFLCLPHGLVWLHALKWADLMVPLPMAAMVVSVAFGYSLWRIQVEWLLVSQWIADWDLEVTSGAISQYWVRRQAALSRWLRNSYSLKQVVSRAHNKICQGHASGEARKGFDRFPAGRRLAHMTGTVHSDSGSLKTAFFSWCMSCWALLLQPGLLSWVRAQEKLWKSVSSPELCPFPQRPF